MSVDSGRRNSLLNMMAGWSWKKWAGMLGALAAMCVSAYGVGRWMSLMAMISGWTGLAQHDSAIPGLKWQAEIWSGIAVVFHLWQRHYWGLGMTVLRRREVCGQVQSADRRKAARATPQQVLCCICCAWGFRWREWC